MTKSKKKGNSHHHDDSSHDYLFYECFAKLLIYAEERQIYKLPPMSNKYCEHALRRFDKFDLAECMLSQCGSTIKYVHLDLFFNVPTITNQVPNNATSTMMSETTSPVNTILNTTTTTTTTTSNNGIPNSTTMNSYCNSSEKKNIYFVVQFKNGSKKTILLENGERTVEEFLKISSKKINMRQRMTKIRDIHGKIIDDNETLLSLSGSLVMVE